MVDLGSFGGTTSEAAGINDLGIVVGGSELPGNSADAAFVYYGSGQIENLNNLVDPSLGWYLAGADSVNNSSQIVVEGYQAGKPDHALLLTPLPEPSSLLLLCSAALGIILLVTFAKAYRSLRC